MYIDFSDVLVLIREYTLNFHKIFPNKKAQNVPHRMLEKYILELYFSKMGLFKKKKNKTILDHIQKVLIIFYVVAKWKNKKLCR